MDPRLHTHHPLHDQGVVNSNRHSDIVFEDDGVDMGEKVEKTYETYLEEKKLKKELKKLVTMIILVLK